MAGAAFAALAGNLLGGITQMENVRQTNLMNANLAKYSYAQQRAMINEQNAYNSPLQQMARYREAGLNPNLIYGNIDSGNQNQIAKYNPPEVQTPDLYTPISNAIKSAMDAQMMKAELDLKKQEMENLREQQFNIRAQRHARDIDNMWKSTLYGFDPGLVKQAGDSEGIQKSLGWKKYNSEYLNLNEQIELNRSRRSLMKVEESLKSVNKKQAEFMYEKVLPLMYEIQDKRSKGLDYSNELLRLQTVWYAPNNIVKNVSSIAGAVSGFINPLSRMGAFGMPSSGMSPYMYGYPSSTMPDMFGF